MLDKKKLALHHTEQSVTQRRQGGESEAVVLYTKYLLGNNDHQHLDQTHFSGTTVPLYHAHFREGRNEMRRYKVPNKSQYIGLDDNNVSLLAVR